jgi:hypothetical protein
VLLTEPITHSNAGVIVSSTHVCRIGLISACRVYRRAHILDEESSVICHCGKLPFLSCLIRRFVIELRHAIFASRASCLIRHLWTHDLSKHTHNLCVIHNQTILGIHVVLALFGSVPLLIYLPGMIAHGSYYWLLKSFPFFAITSPQFLASAGKFCNSSVV